MSPFGSLIPRVFNSPGKKSFSEIIPMMTVTDKIKRDLDLLEKEEKIEKKRKRKGIII
jgi:hypothetical protein